ncbi:MAG: hypothetical protein H7Z13_09850 [Ferruginibacter sp.]|nr:hypothetical protein [Ferruginibacter sp.]
MFKFIFAIIIYCIAFTGNIFAQDTLPKISVKNRDGKVIVSWKNTYGAKINNVNIQRSTDSIKRFTTIGSVLNPMNKENGFVDSKSPGGKIFYRVFVAFDGGDYLFTRSYRPVADTSMEKDIMELPEEKTGKPVTAPNFVPSKFVFTGKDNNVIINLSNAASRKFSIKFFDEDDDLLFEVHNIKEPYLILEKVNFLHSGWFKYHLYDNDILLEKYKFYIPKDGKNSISDKEQRYK